MKARLHILLPALIAALAVLPGAAAHAEGPGTVRSLLPERDPSPLGSAGEANGARPALGSDTLSSGDGAKAVSPGAQGLSMAQPQAPARTDVALGRDEIGTLFSEASELFRQANAEAKTNPDRSADLYRRAILRFERIVREGETHNGRLYYNIGNAYFRMGDIGRAILNYRRALAYTPNDPNLHQNLSYARQRRLDSIEERQETRILKTLFFWHYDLSGRTRAVLFGFFFVAAWLFAAVRVVVRRPFALWCLAVSAVLAALLLASLLTETIAFRTQRPGVILNPEVVARKGDSETYEPSFREPLHAGTEFTLVESRGDWYHIELADGRRCWIPAAQSERVR